MRYLITFSYDGSKYYGYQKQKNIKTVQDELERALSLINNKVVIVSASGRTDAGVHAINQCAHFDLDIKITPDKLKKALNSLLDGDIYIKDIKEVSSEFHARFNVKKKEYIYKINLGEYNPLAKDYIYQYCKSLDIDNMKLAIKFFEGTHNFKSFTKANVETENFIRTIFSTDIFVNNNNILEIKFVGNGFMRYMVRNMVGFLIEIGSGIRKISDVERVLLLEDRTKAGKTAPPEGLYLNKVEY